MTEDWQQILAEFGPDVWRTVRCLVGNEADARDCYQVVFLDAFQFSKKQPIRDWKAILKRMARLRALDHLRKRYRHAAYVDSGANTADVVSSLPSPEANVESTELGERLRRSLAELTAEQAEVFVMRYVDQMRLRRDRRTHRVKSKCDRSEVESCSKATTGLLDKPAAGKLRRVKK